MATEYGCRPSDIVGIDDPYTRYCFDEACFYIRTQTAKEEGEQQPQFEKSYNSFSDMYEDILKGGE